jgi:hypothetical protein
MLYNMARHFVLARVNSLAFLYLHAAAHREVIILYCRVCSVRQRLMQRAPSASAYSISPSRSAGLCTPRGPRFSTCVYIIVVLTSLCPSNS